MSTVDPDGLERLYTPHRLAYVKSEAPEAEPGCPFCRIGAAPAGADGDLEIGRAHV